MEAARKHRTATPGGIGPGAQPPKRDGKEGVAGSSPAEGSPKKGCYGAPCAVAVTSVEVVPTSTERPLASTPRQPRL
jgi:hypothetical protein